MVGDAELASRIVDHALEQGVFAEAVRPPAVPEGTARVRLSVMASHTRAGAARARPTVLGRAALRAGFRPGAGLPVAAAHGAVFDGQRAGPPARPGRRGESLRAASARRSARGRAAALTRGYNPRRPKSRTPRPNRIARART